MKTILELHNSTILSQTYLNLKKMKLRLPILLLVTLIYVTNPSTAQIIVYTDIPDQVIDSSNTVFDLDINQDAIFDFQMRFTPGPGGAPYSAFELYDGPAAIDNRCLVDDGIGDALNMSSGESIQPIVVSPKIWYDLTSGGLTLSMMAYLNGAAMFQWAGGATDKYLGISFAIGANTHYGWIRVDVTSGTPEALTIKDFAYNTTPNAPIIAGDAGCASAGTDGTATLCSSAGTVDLFDSLVDGSSGGIWFPALASGTGVIDPQVDTSGTYQYIITGTGTCVNDTANVMVTIDTPPDAGSNGTATVSSTGGMVDLFNLLGGSPGATGTWSPALTSGTGVFDPTTDAAGTYTYTVAGVGMCADDTSQVVVTINNTTSLSGTVNVKQNVTIYPNPSNGMCNINIHNSSNDAVDIKLTNILGKEMMQLNERTVNGEIAVNFSDLPNGIYFMNLKFDNQFKIVKMMKQ